MKGLPDRVQRAVPEGVSSDLLHVHGLLLGGEIDRVGNPGATVSHAALGRRGKGDVQGGDPPSLLHERLGDEEEEDPNGPVERGPVVEADGRELGGRHATFAVDAGRSVFPVAVVGTAESAAAVGTAFLELAGRDAGALDEGFLVLAPSLDALFVFSAFPTGISATPVIATFLAFAEGNTGDRRASEDRRRQRQHLVRLRDHIIDIGIGVFLALPDAVDDGECEEGEECRDRPLIPID